MRATVRLASHSAVLCCLLFAGLSAGAQTINIDAKSGGRVFDGVGAISGGGGNSRLLIDYAEPYRSQILDYLFKPGYGANIQIFKVEIGADMDSTDGAESSHMHTRNDENYDRGYEWWLMEQAKARNPDIKFVALAWGAPGWVGDGNYWSQDMIDYMIKWLKHAQSDHHLTVDYLGGRNEHGYDVQWYKDLRAKLRANGLGHIKVIASDDWEPHKLWNIASEMKKDPAVDDAIDIVGVHGPGWGGYSTPDALSLGKPLWDSESHFDEIPPYNEMARNIPRNYAAGKVTATVYWPIISAIYENLPFDNVGLIKCNEPWSGHYAITPSVWVMAHTTQFAKPGWTYIDSASGFFDGDRAGGHGSFVTLKSPQGTDFSIIIETVQSKATETERFTISGFGKKTLHLWATDLTSSNPAGYFVKQEDVAVTNGKFALELQPGHVYSVTTTTGQAKGDAVAPASAPFNLPYSDNFNTYRIGKSARYFSDMYGAFETTRCDGGRGGICLSQLSPQEPIVWKRTAGRPFTMLGNLEWTDYTISTDILFEQPTSVDLIGRLSGMGDNDTPNSYVLRVSDAGSWSIIRTAVKGNDVVLASGLGDALGIRDWHHLSLSFSGGTISALLDGKPLKAISDTAYTKGMVGLGVVNYGSVQFDNFAVSSPQKSPAP